MAKSFVGQEYMAATNGKGLQQQSKGNRFLTRATVTFSTIITVFSVFIVAFCLAFQICPVHGKSMMTTLNATGDDTDKALTCMVGKPSRGEIVVMKLYIQNMNLIDYYQAANGDLNALNRLKIRHNDSTYTPQRAAATLKKTIENQGYDEHDKTGNYKLIVKRLIGMPGDIISMRRIGGNFYIYLNGELLDETYLDPLVADHNAANFENLWIVLNNPENADMDDWVTTDYHDLLSTNTVDTAADGNGVPSTYMLTIPDEYYFLMGDNRGSADEYAKSWDSVAFGPLPISNYYSYCVDVLSNDTSMPSYLWDKFVYYVCFGWVWKK